MSKYVEDTPKTKKRTYNLGSKHYFLSIMRLSPNSNLLTHLFHIQVLVYSGIYIKYFLLIRLFNLVLNFNNNFTKISYKIKFVNKKEQPPAETIKNNDKKKLS